MTKIIKLTTAIISLISILGCSDDKPTLEIYTWSDYIESGLIQKAEEKFNCHINITTFDSNEAMYAKLKAGATGYDIINPSSYMIPMLVKEGILTPVDHSKIPNVLDNFDHTYDKFIIDPEMNFSVPYIISYAGIMYNKEKADIKDPSWDIFSNSKYLGKVSLLDDIREVIGIGLMYNGYSINSENPEEIDKAVKTILSWRNNVRKFDAESYKTEVSSGSIYFGHAYSSDSFQVILGDDENEERTDIGFAYPKEGFSVACDEFAVTSSSTKKDLAFAFINFMYEVENSKISMEYNVSVMPNKKSISLLNEKMKNLIVLDEETAKRGQNIGEFKNPKTQDLYNSAWDKIRSIKK